MAIPLRPAPAMSTTTLADAVRCLRAGGILAYPTEAVWGLGCDPGNAAAVARLLALKQRAPDKGLILIAGSLAQVQPWLAGLSEAQRATLCASWPGPVTWRVPDAAGIAPDWVRGAQAGVALRVSAHPLVQALCAAFGGPLVSTSANPAGQPAARTQAEVEAYFGDRVQVLPGDTGGRRQPSEIRDLLTGAILRHG